MAARIAEGAGKPTDGEFTGELNRSRAANHEVEYLLLLSHDVGFLNEGMHQELSGELREVRKMISGLVKRVTGGS
jgi:four helix bundle protein